PETVGARDPSMGEELAAEGEFCWGRIDELHRAGPRISLAEGIGLMGAPGMGQQQDIDIPLAAAEVLQLIGCDYICATTDRLEVAPVIVVKHAHQGHPFASTKPQATFSAL